MIEIAAAPFTLLQSFFTEAIRQTGASCILYQIRYIGVAVIGLAPSVEPDALMIEDKLMPDAAHNTSDLII